MKAYHARRAPNSGRLLLDGLEKEVGFDIAAFGTLDPKNQAIINTCLHLLDQDESSAVIVFVQFHSELDILEGVLKTYWKEDKNAVITYHGVLQQSQKNARLALLKSGKVKVFLATLQSAGTVLTLTGCRDWLL